MSDIRETFDMVLDQLSSDVAQLMQESVGDYQYPTKSSIWHKKIRALNEIKSMFHNAGFFQKVEELELRSCKDFINSEIKKTLMQVGGEISEDTRMSKKSREFAIAIVLNKMADLGGINLNKKQDKE